MGIGLKDARKNNEFLIKALVFLLDNEQTGNNIWNCTGDKMFDEILERRKKLKLSSTPNNIDTIENILIYNTEWYGDIIGYPSDDKYVDFVIWGNKTLKEGSILALLTKQKFIGGLNCHLAYQLNTPYKIYPLPTSDYMWVVWKYNHIDNTMICWE